MGYFDKQLRGGTETPEGDSGATPANSGLRAVLLSGVDKYGAGLNGSELFGLSPASHLLLSHNKVAQPSLSTYMFSKNQTDKKQHH